MKTVFSLLLLLVSLSAWGQSAATEPPNLNVMPQGMILRGKLTEFSVTADKTVQDLAGGVFRMGLSECREVVFAALRNRPILQPGALLAGREHFYNSPVASMPYAPRDPNGLAYAGDRMCELNADFSTAPVSGPGELFKVGLYFPIWESAPSLLAVVREHPSPHIAYTNEWSVDFRDAQDRKIPIRVGSVPTRMDIRYFGDVNRDQEVDVRDVIRMLRAVVGLETFTEAEAWYADLHPASPDGRLMANRRFLGDGTVDVQDVATALRVLTKTWTGWWPDMHIAR